MDSKKTKKKEKKEKNLKFKVKALARFMRGAWGYFVLCVLCALGTTAAETLSPQIIKVTVDSVLDSKESSLPDFVTELINRAGGYAFFREHLYYVAGMIVVLALFTALFQYFFRVTNSFGAETLVKTMRDDVFRHIGRLPFSWHMKNQTGDIIQRCTSDVDMIKRFLSEQLTSVFRIVTLLILSITFMSSMSGKLTLIAVAFMPFIILYSLSFHKKIGKAFTECDENEGKLSAITQENLTGVRVVRAFGREKYELSRFEAQNGKYASLLIRFGKTLSMFWSSADLLSGLQVMCVIIFGAVACIRGSMTTGEYIAFISYNSMLVWPVRQLGRMISDLSRADVSLSRLTQILQAEEERDRPGAVTPDMRGDIVFDKVSFAYESCPQILRDISFDIKASSTIGILGGTGSGKSTLMYLLNRLYDIPEGCGKITIGGVDIADMKAEWVRSNIGMVLQEPFLFSRSISENIGITKENITFSDIKEAARIACLDETVENFSKGYDTFVGERGVTLSGGQKQRAAIARMLTQKTPIMIFDDSLSAVDTETDAKIRHALTETLGQSTVILISHRITTLMHADKIIVLDRGEVAEQGTHEELLEKNGIYKKIYQIQTQGSETA